MYYYPQKISLTDRFGSEMWKYDKETAQGDRKSSGFMIGDLNLSPASGTN